LVQILIQKLTQIINCFSGVYLTVIYEYPEHESLPSATIPDKLASFVTLCEIRDFRDVERKCKDTALPKKWKNIITQQAWLNQKWFYLPPDERIGFHEDSMRAFSALNPL
jgi:hypothetical protein